jgi:hypothetical protein
VTRTGRQRDRFHFARASIGTLRIPASRAYRIMAGLRLKSSRLASHVPSPGDGLMQVIEHWTPKGETIYMDGKRYLNCIFTECKIVYGGGDVMWENTQFVNCQLVFDGAAQRTIAYLTNLGLMKPPAGMPMPNTLASSVPN